MMRTDRSNRGWRTRRLDARGFTLLEILIGVICFAIVLAAINTVYFGGLRLRNTTMASLERALPVEQTLATLKRDLGHLLPPGGTFAGELQTTPSTNTSASLRLAGLGEPVSPELYTASAVMDDTSRWTDIQRVVYHLVAPTDPAATGRDLVRFVTRNLLPVTEEEAVGQRLMGGVENVIFYYFDGAYWNDTWDSTLAETPLPAAIKVEIELARSTSDAYDPAPITLVVPLVLGGPGNQPAQQEAVE